MVELFCLHVAEKYHVLLCGASLTFSGLQSEFQDSQGYTEKETLSVSIHHPNPCGYISGVTTPQEKPPCTCDSAPWKQQSVHQEQTLPGSIFWG